MTKSVHDDQVTSSEASNSEDGLQGVNNRNAPPAPAWPKKQVLWHDRHVCCIDIVLSEPGRTVANGTGFLIGADLVLTNYHVIEDRKENREFPITHLKCRFDYRHSGGNENVFGTTVAVKKIERTRSYAKSEGSAEYGNNSSEHPASHELDYAVLRIERKVGCEPYTTEEGSAPRRWITLPTTKPEVHQSSELFILQHAEGAPVQEALGTRLEHQPAPTRLRYDTSTLPGSSGSPCFQFLADGSDKPVVVALHNYGEPNWRNNGEPTFNHGIPIELIARDLKRAGIEISPYLEPAHRPHPRSWFRIAQVGAVLGIVGVILAFLLWPPPSKCWEALRQADNSRNAGSYEIAVERYKKADELCNRTLPAPLKGEGDSLYRLGRYAASAARYKEAYDRSVTLRDNDSMAESRLGQGYALEGQGDMSRALKAYRSGIESANPAGEIYRHLVISEGRALTVQWLAHDQTQEDTREQASEAFHIFLDHDGEPKQWAYYYLACLNSGPGQSIAVAKDHLTSAAVALRDDKSRWGASERAYFKDLITKDTMVKPAPVSPPGCPSLVALVRQPGNYAWMSNLLDGF